MNQSVFFNLSLFLDAVSYNGLLAFTASWQDAEIDAATGKFVEYTMSAIPLSHFATSPKKLNALHNAECLAAYNSSTLILTDKNRTERTKRTL